MKLWSTRDYAFAVWLYRHDGAIRPGINIVVKKLRIWVCTGYFGKSIQVYIGLI